MTTQRQHTASIYVLEVELNSIKLQDINLKLIDARTHSSAPHSHAVAGDEKETH